MSGGQTNTSQTDTSAIHLGGHIKNGGAISIGGNLSNGGSKFDDQSDATGAQTGLDVGLKGMPMGLMLVNLDAEEEDLLNMVLLKEDSDLDSDYEDVDEDSDQEILGDDEEDDLMNLRRKAKKGRKTVKKGLKKSKRKSSKKGKDTEKEAWKTYDKAMNKLYDEQNPKAKKSKSKKVKLMLI